MNNNKFHVMSSWTRNKTNKEPTKNWQLDWVSILLPSQRERERERESTGHFNFTFLMLLKCRSYSIGQISQIWRLKKLKV